MSTNSPEQRAARLLQDILEDVYLDRIHDELEEEHPVDSELFLDDLTTGRLSPAALAEFRQHLRGCLLCNEVVGDLRSMHSMPWLPDREAENVADNDVVPAFPVVPAVSSLKPAAAVSTAANSLQEAREQLAMRGRTTDHGGRRTMGGGRKLAVAVVVGIAATLLLLAPGLRTLLQPSVSQSAFATLATMSDYGLRGQTGGRDLTPEDLRTVETLRTTLKRGPEDPTARLNLAAQLLTTRQLDEARMLIESVLQIRPQDPQVLNALALVQIASKERQTALLTLQKAVAIKPLFAPAALNLADLLLDDGRAQEAKTVLSEALQRPLSSVDTQRLQQRLNSLQSMP